MKKDIWKTIPGHDGYEANNFGRIASWRPLSRNSKPPTERRILKPGRADKSGHLVVNIHDGNGGAKTMFVHRLILETFIGPRPDGMECCHEDGNAANNRLDNLRWDTHQSNCADSVRHGRSNRGARTWSCVLTESQVLAIRADDRYQHIVACDYGVSRSLISHIHHRKVWGWL